MKYISFRFFCTCKINVNFLLFQVEKLLDPTVWLDAATQVFYSFGLAFGSLIAFGSYNTPKNNCVRDVVLVSVCNAITAIYASVVIFAILGFKAMSNVEKCIQRYLQFIFNHYLFIHQIRNLNFNLFNRTKSIEHTNTKRD